MTATLRSLPVLAPWWFVVGVAHFGFVTGPEPTMRLSISTAAWALVPSALFLGPRLRSRLHRACGRVISRPVAVMGAFVGLLPVQVSIGVVTLHQYGNDSGVFLLGCTCGLIAIVATLARFSHRAPEPRPS